MHTLALYLRVLRVEIQLRRDAPFTAFQPPPIVSASFGESYLGIPFPR